ncbi:hypothetical protein [Mesorhizobium sp. Pch-S]|uniref:hypothetical protein n=1 Tax=Mesorhizobium sp. Pch-S TaxID=2082387 RepID=UPI0013EAA1DB|nr:hypothetical protein [Mesorhizobium sp. Pch-S]
MTQQLAAYVVALFFGGVLIGIEGHERRWSFVRMAVVSAAYASVIFLIGAPA